MNSDLSRYMADALVDDHLREAKRLRRSRFGRGEAPDPYEPVTVRLARSADADAIMRLSELDGRRVPRGSILVAEVDGAVLAARSLDASASVADPFRPTAHLTELLELRSVHLRTAANGHVKRGRRRFRTWVRTLGRRPTSGTSG